MADRGAAALAIRMSIVESRTMQSPTVAGPQTLSDARAILGDRGVYLPDGLDVARLRTIAILRVAGQGFLMIDNLDNAIALAVDDILADLGVPMTDTVGGR